MFLVTGLLIFKQVIIEQFLFLENTGCSSAVGFTTYIKDHLFLFGIKRMLNELFDWIILGYFSLLYTR